MAARGRGTRSGAWAARRDASGTLRGAALRPMLVGALGRLDPVLGVAIEQQARRLGPQSLIDPWRGMHLELAEVRRLLAHAEAPAGAAGVADLLGAAMAPLPALAGVGVTDWSPLDLALWLLVLAPELDLRYERLYGYLQDDLTRRRPTPDLLANLLATDAEQRLAVLARLAPEAPLRRHAVLEPVVEGSLPWLARGWQLDALWRDWMLGHGEPELPSACAARVLRPPADAEDAACSALPAWLQDGHSDGRAPRLHLHGPHGAGKLRLAAAVAARRGQRLLVVDLRRWCEAGEAREQARRVLRAAALFDLLPFLHGAAALAQSDGQALRAALDELAEQADAGFVLATASTLPPLHAGTLAARRLDVGFPSAARRTLLWRRALQSRGLAAGPSAVSEVGTRFVLSAAQIDQAAADAQPDPGAARKPRAPLDYPALCAAARRQSGAELSAVAQRLAPQAGFDALVAVAEVHDQLREICARVATREAVRRDWSGGSVHGRAQGVTALFVGPSGTGKTLSAEALACELGLDLYRIDLAGIVSKYIGETEKNLDRVFTAAEHANAVLFFDEADALFGKRSEVKDAHDRYANIEVAYLLQKMEQFDGLAILATNLKQNLDEAFARRLTFTVNFPFPEEAERRRLWEQLWPPRAPRHCDVDLAWFAREFRLSGGHIRNTVWAAAHLAAVDGQVVTRAHLLHATRREFQKLGKNLPAPDRIAA